MSESEFPLVFVVGDSISLYYGPALEAGLKGAYAYARKGGTEEAFRNLDVPQGANGGDSGMVLEYLSDLLAQPAFCPDLLLVNCGLHDIKVKMPEGQLQVSPEAYRQNLQTLLARVQERGIPFVWVRTTHSVDEIHNRHSPNFHRYAKDNEAYDAIALEVMQAAGVPVADLRTFTRHLGEDAALFRDHVHFTPEVAAQQGAFLAGWVLGRRQS